MTYRTIGDTVIEWQYGSLTSFTVTQPTGSRDRKVSSSISIDLSLLENGFTDNFLSALKQHLIECCSRVKITTLKTEYARLRSLFSQIIKLELFNAKVEIIDEGFLLCLAAVESKFKASTLKYLKSAFLANPHSSLFSRGLLESDFPSPSNKKGQHAQCIDNILAKALTRSAAAYILDVCDRAYTAGTMGIDHYSFIHLSFAVFVRPNSYRQIRLEDLSITSKGQYFVEIISSKTNEKYPSSTSFRINEPLGVLLTKQRQHVISTYGHLVPQEEIHKLALFPCRKLKVDKSQWRSAYANNHFGMHESGGDFDRSYSKLIRRLHFKNDRITIGATALRHTIGTLLAQTGASSKTIQAVLKHATNTVCKAYVDIAFHGLMDELSESMYPAFAEHLPAFINFRSRVDPAPTEKLVLSWNQDFGKLENIGECGKSMVCANAPIVCYGCSRFVPCWDADHSINLRLVEQEIEDMRKLGKPFEHMVDRAIRAKNKIIIVMYAADRYHQALQTRSQT